MSCLWKGIVRLLEKLSSDSDSNSRIGMRRAMVYCKVNMGVKVVLCRVNDNCKTDEL